MDFFKLIEQRRSIRKYQAKQIEPEIVALIIEAALRAPASRNLSPWEFIVVTDPSIIRELAAAKQQGSTFLEKAPLAVVVCADPGKGDVWIEDAAIASTFISLAAEGLGLGNCWIQIRGRSHNAAETSEEYVRKVLKMPSHLRVETIMAIGYSDEQKCGHPKEELLYERVFTNAYGEGNSYK